jgi:plastocyanin
MLAGSLALGAIVVAVGGAVAATSGVALTSQGPTPATVTVEWGDTVEFTNGDSVGRGVTIPRVGVTSPTLAPGEKFSYRFDGRAGRYGYMQTGAPAPATRSGAVVVNVTGKLTLVSSAAVAPYGSQVTLSGRSSYPGTPVVVQSRPAGASGDWTTLATVPAAGNGTYSTRFRLTAGARLRARTAADQVTSSTLSIGVRPLLRIRVAPRTAQQGTRIVVTGVVVPGAAARSANLEERLAGRTTWSRKDTKRVPRTGKVSFTFRAVAGRTRYRIVLNRTGLQPGFEPVSSATVLVVGTTPR